MRRSLLLASRFLVLVVLFPTSAPLAAEDPDSGPPLVIGALYINNATGIRFRDGIVAAVDHHELANRVRLEPFPYANHKLGIETLTRLIEGGHIDVVLGPTESGIYVDAIAKRGTLEKYKVPVISSLVTADVPHQEYGWFFRTNVNVQRRAFTIYDFLNKYWIRSIAVLYADTEFGERAERAFQLQLNSRQRERYLPLRYESSPLDARKELRRVLDARPEAVGIFGERSDVRYIYERLGQMNQGRNAYRPMIFTLIDTRHVDGVDDIYFVSVTNPASELDDVGSLAYDTTVLLLNQLRAVPQDASNEERRQLLRDLFESALKGGVELPAAKTGFVLASYENMTRPRVLHHCGDTLEEAGLGTVGLADKLKTKYRLVHGRFGRLPVFNLFVVIFIVVVVSIADIKKWHSGSWIGLFRPRNYPFYLLLFTNMAIVAGLYVFLGETEAISYGSTIAALVIAVAPLAALRVNLFETAAGKQIGVGKLYESFLQWVNDRLMLMEHRETKKLVNLIAYHNSVDGMKSYLKGIYRYNRSSSQRMRLETELEETVNSSLPYLLRRKVCARLLLRTANWNELQEDGLAPEGSVDEMRDPETVIREAARYCANNEEAADALEREIDSHLDRIGTKDENRKKDLDATLQRDLQGAIGTQGRLRRKLAFLFVLHGFSEQYLQEHVLMSPGATSSETDHGDAESVSLSERARLGY